VIVRIALVPLLTLTLGCGVIDGLLTESEDQVAAGGECGPTSCGVTGDCLRDDCELLCGFSGICSFPEDAYSQCGAAQSLSISDDFDLFVYDLSFNGGDACFNFEVIVEDLALLFSAENDADIVLQTTAGSISTLGFTTINDSIYTVGFEVCGVDAAESVAIQWVDGPRRSNPMCVVDNFIPQGFGGGGDLPVDLP
jgi:hypothetical protein